MVTGAVQAVIRSRTRSVLFATNNLVYLFRITQKILFYVDYSFLETNSLDQHETKLPLYFFIYHE